jgi:aspartate 1-decarboxylase
MKRVLLSGKIRDIRLTALQPDYEGSITLDEEYMERAGIFPYEEVHVLNLNSGTRIITYAIKGERGSGCVELNGPAARHGRRRSHGSYLRAAGTSRNRWL